MAFKYDGTLLSMLEPRMGRRESDTAFLFWDGVWPLWYQKKLSYERLRADSQAFAYALRNILGISPEERMLMLLGNFTQFPIAYFGAQYAGVVPVPVNPLLEKEKILALLKNSGATAILAVDRLYPVLADIAEEAGVKKIILTSIAGSLPYFKARKYLEREKSNIPEIPYGDGRTYNFSELLSDSFTRSFSVNVMPGDKALILYTSGTASEPKGVLLSHEALLQNALACRKLLMFDLGIPKNKPVFLAAAPYFHIMGISALLHTSLLMDAKTILIAEKNPLVLTKKILEAASYTKAVAFVGAPMHYESMVKILARDIKKYDLSHLKLCLSGSARLTGEARKFEPFWGGKILEGFGQSEIGILTCQRPWKAKPGSVGRALEGVALKISDADENGVGELLAKSPGTMYGYWNNIEKTRSVIDGEGRLHTGDLAKIDEDGDVFLYDRVDDIIKLSNGEKLSALEVENEILKHSQVVEAAVVAVKAEAGGSAGEILKAFVVLRDPQMHDISQDIIKHCRKSLSSGKAPDVVECVKELPKNAFGKVLKRVLRNS